MAGKQDRSDLVKGRTDIRAARRELLDELYGRLGKARDAIEAEPIVEAIEATWSRTGSDTVDLLMARAGAFVREADLDVAVKIFDAVVDLAPDEAEAWHQRAMLHFMRQDYRRCLSDLRRALLLDPRHYKAINALGVVLQEFGDKKAALEAYRKALQVNPYLDSARQSAEELAREVEGQGI
jgi:Flp pilus assembly protein TadD